MRGLLLLLRTELRALRWFFLPAILLALLGPTAASRLLQWLGEAPLAPAGYVLASGVERPAWDDLQVLALWAFALQLTLHALSGAGARGRDDFLARLPLSPRAAFGAQALACALILLVVPLLRHGVFLCGHALFGTWPPELGAGVALPLLCADLVRALVVCGLSMTLAHARGHAWLIFGCALLGSRGASTQGWIPPAADLLRLGVPEHGPGVSLGGATVWLLLAGGATAWSYLLQRRRRPRSSARRIRGVLGSLRAGLALLVGVLLPLTLLGAEARLGPRGVSYPDARLTARTSRYVFRSDARLAGRARSLIESAETLHADVAGRLGLSAAAELPILELELTAGEPGLLTGRETQLALSEDPTWHRFELALVTARTLSDHASGGRLSAWRRPLATLAEGLSRHVACHTSGRDPFDSRFQAAVLHSRRAVQLDEVFDREELVRLRGEEGAAAIGEAFVEAMRREYGSQAAPRLLEAIAKLSDRPPPSRADGCLSLWRDLLAGAGFDALRLEQRLLEVLEDSVRDDPRAAVALPRLDAIMRLQESPTGWRIIAVPDQDVPPGWFVVCRIRRMGGVTERAQRLGPEANGCEAFFTFSSPFAAPPRVQVGLRPVVGRPLLGILWEDWQAPSGRP